MTNSIVLEGNIVADATVKAVGETQLTEFKVANTRYLSKDKEKTVFILCKMWGARGVAVQSYLQKGKRVTVTGALEIDEWEKDGIRRSMANIVVTDLSLAPKGAAPKAVADSVPSPEPSVEAGASEEFNDDIPF